MWFEIEYYPYKLEDFPTKEEIMDDSDSWDLATVMCRSIWAVEQREEYDEGGELDKKAKEIVAEAAEKLKELKKDGG